MDIIALVLSILSFMVAFVSLYFSFLNKGKLSIPPLRAYKIEPLNFHLENNSYRAFRMFIPVSFVNTGAKQLTINELRIKITIESDSLILKWENELMALNHNANEGEFATQPTIKAYESISRIYTFVSGFTQKEGEMVMQMEKANVVYKATLEQRIGTKDWQGLLTFNVKHDGINHHESNFDFINK